MAISSNGFNKKSSGSMYGDLHAQEAASLNRRVQPASPEEFIKWVRQTLRDQSTLYSSLSAKHKKLDQAGQLATVGLTRLGSLVKFNDRISYEHLLDLHRDFTFKNQNISYTLLRCKEVIDETTLNMQFVAETLKAPLADRHKKIAAQKELGLRLRDTDADFEIAKRAIGGQDKLFRQLSEGIQMLMSKASLKLPANVKEAINREDAVAKIALTHKKSLQKGHDVINSNQYEPPKTINKVKMMAGLGQNNAEVDETIEVEEIIPENKGVDLQKALASTTVGLIVGILLFYVILSK